MNIFPCSFARQAYSMLIRSDAISSGTSFESHNGQQQLECLFIENTTATKLDESVSRQPDSYVETGQQLLFPLGASSIFLNSKQATNLLGIGVMQCWYIDRDKLENVKLVID
ncbi:hypothetical protein T07_10773 [Trichinella nelsoni]|uniref:Uncharacterized protein n=1 Tax=Trichinella nelsoni TaxID=6336 RepID=A0A0V0RYB7_9BILA|nr:hypothetical protein T07_10773 [Trichinella nelsoni]